MALNRRALLAVAATSVTAAVAGCGGDDADESGDGGTGPTTTVETTTAAPTSPPPTTTPTSEPASTVRVRSHPDLGDILVGPDGRTLYMFDNDTQGAGASSCTGDCASAWPPLTVEAEPVAGEAVSASLSTFERGDGSTQVAANGWPLYYFASDAGPGEVKGQGVGDVWWVLRPDGTPVRAADQTTTTTAPTTTTAASAVIETRDHNELGEILVGPSGMTVYMFDQDTKGAAESNCSGSCADSWPPVTVSDGIAAGDGVTAPLSTFERADGDTQVSANGWPLYYYAGDQSPSDATGQGVGDAWWVLRPDGSPVKPTTTTTEDDGMDGY